MSTLFEQFSDFSEITDVRQGIYNEVTTVIEALEAFNTDDLQALQTLVSRSNLPRLLQRYNTTFNEATNGNRTLAHNIRSISFTRFKPVLGGFIYV